MAQRAARKPFDNDIEEELIRVGPGTPSGELFRRYWIAVEASCNLGGARGRANNQRFQFSGARNPIRVKVLDEELILFRDASGEPALLAEHCSHRGTSLFYGRVEDDCIRCLYHGWAYDREGNVKDLPCEPAGSNLYKVKHPAYPCVEVGGLIFAYMGPPEKKPPFPKYDILFRQDGVRVTGNGGYVQACNVFQAMHDNNLDVWHTEIAHKFFRPAQMPQQLHHGRDGRPASPIRYDETPWGNRDVAIKDTEFPDQAEYYELHTVYPSTRCNFPNGRSMKFGTPIDDFNTRWFVVDFYPLDEGGHPTAESLRAANNTTNGLSRATMEPGWPAQVGGWWDHGNPLRQGVMWEDEIICATQGTSDRNNLPNWEEWHLGSSDRGVVFQRKQWREQVERVRKGLDPIGIVRDPAEAEKMIHVTADFKRMSWEDAARMFDMSVDERLAQIERGEVPGVPTRSF